MVTTATAIIEAVGMGADITRAEEVVTIVDVGAIDEVVDATVVIDQMKSMKRGQTVRSRKTRILKKQHQEVEAAADTGKTVHHSLLDSFY